VAAPRGEARSAARLLEISLGVRCTTPIDPKSQTKLGQIAGSFFGCGYFAGLSARAFVLTLEKSSAQRRSTISRSSSETFSACSGPRCTTCPRTSLKPSRCSASSTNPAAAAHSRNQERRGEIDHARFPLARIVPHRSV